MNINSRSFLYCFYFLFLMSCSQESALETPKLENNKQEFRLNIREDPASLDPRKAQTVESFNVLKMLFEGLTSIDQEGGVTFALAKGVQVSKDLKTYTFTLKPSLWSDGSALTAHDFVFTWKSLLDPLFPSQFAHFLFVIKNGQQVKKGEESLDKLGVQALDDHTLVVHLEAPTPYFLQLLSTPTFFPVKQKLVKENSKWAHSGDIYVSNGPFSLASWKNNDEINLVKNQNFRDVNKVSLETIKLVMVDEATELLMFQAGELDWAGSPLSVLSSDAIVSLKKEKKVKVLPALGTHFFRFNVTKKPFDNAKIRKAFSYAISRETLVEHVLQGGQREAMGFLPPSIKRQEHGYFLDNSVKEANQLLEEGLKEEGLSKSQLPTIKITYTMTDRNHKIVQAIQQQWKEGLGVDVQLENLEGKVFFQKRREGDFQIANSSWIGDFSDPVNFLDIFKYKEQSSNCTFWENLEYINFLNLSEKSGVTKERDIYLQKAEALLMEEMPIVPLFFYTFVYLKNQHLIGEKLSDLGYLDLQTAHF